VFGRDRPLPLDTEEGDILLIDTVGAYGRCMASTYNLRDPGKEVVILDSGEIVWPPQ
jgi:diaminopimelate decarboxylase/aspartate kinase